MRKRLIELIKKANYIVKRNGFEFNANVMADYLLAEGVIVSPCKVGDKLYLPIRHRVLSYVVLSIKYDGERLKLTLQNLLSGNYMSIYQEAVGKTVFLTKEEAEKAIAEREG